MYWFGKHVSFRLINCPKSINSECHCFSSSRTRYLIVFHWQNGSANRFGRKIVSDLLLAEVIIFTRALATTVGRVSAKPICSTEAEEEGEETTCRCTKQLRAVQGDHRPCAHVQGIRYSKDISITPSDVSITS